MLGGIPFGQLFPYSLLLPPFSMPHNTSSPELLHPLGGRGRLVVMLLSASGFMLAWCFKSRVRGEAVVVGTLVVGTLCDGASPQMQ